MLFVWSKHPLGQTRNIFCCGCRFFGPELIRFWWLRYWHGSLKLRTNNPGLPPVGGLLFGGLRAWCRGSIHQPRGDVFPVAFEFTKGAYSKVTFGSWTVILKPLLFAGSSRSRRIQCWALWLDRLLGCVSAFVLFRHVGLTGLTQLPPLPRCRASRSCVRLCWAIFLKALQCRPNEELVVVWQMLQLQAWSAKVASAFCTQLVLMALRPGRVELLGLLSLPSPKHRV